MRNETRFRAVEREYPQRFAELSGRAQRFVTDRYARYQQLAGLPPNGNGHATSESVASAKPQAAAATPAATPVSAKPVAVAPEPTTSPAPPPLPPSHAMEQRPLRIIMTAGN